MVQNAPAEDSAAPGSSAPNIVRLPDGNTVTLAPEATPGIAAAILHVLGRGAPSLAVAIGRLSDLYVSDLCIVDWSFTEDGKPVELTAANIARLITIRNGAVDVAERADALYLKDVMDGPFVPRFAKRSPPGPTDASTPPSPGSGTSSRTPSTRSSRGSSAAGIGSEVPVP